MNRKEINQKRLVLINSVKCQELRNRLFQVSIRKCGKHINVGEGIFFLEGNNLEVGNGVHICRKVRFLNKENIKIGNNVWIGEKTTIFSNVRIGDNVVIAPNSIITKSIP